MGSLREFLSRNKVYAALVGGVVVGLAVGLLIGWVLWPLELKNAAPSYLHARYRDDYVAWVAQQYEAQGGVEWAREKLGVEYWDKGELGETLERVAQARGGETGAQLRALKAALESQAAPAQPAAPEPAAPQAPLVQKVSPIVLVCGIALLVAALVGGVVLLLSSRMRGGRQATTARMEGVIGGAFAGAEGQDWGLEGPPQAQFVTSYTLGDDHYDPSFSIELENGEFMGECGVGISESIGVGDPSKVTAFEVWLFDKNDIRTVTKVLMSDYAFHDDALYTKLAPKGEPVLAEVGEDVVLETRRLRVRVRILDMAYGVGNLPPNSFFERIKLELAAWVKPVPEFGGPMTSGDTVPSVQQPML
jgi:hypothetical protein